MSNGMLASLDDDTRAFVSNALKELEEGDEEGLDGLVDLLAAHGLSGDVKGALMLERRNGSAAPAASGSLAAAPAATASVLPSANAAGSSTATSQESLEHIADASDISMLAEVVPQASRSMVALMLEQHGHDTEAALEALLGAAAAADGPSLADMEAEMRARREDAQRRAAREEKRKAKSERRRVLARNDLERDFHADGDRGLHLAPPRIPYTESRKQALQTQQTFYRDGQSVHMKPAQMKNQSKWEKKEEWDGGSEGKVFTKGKRGKGYV